MKTLRYYDHAKNISNPAVAHAVAAAARDAIAAGNAWTVEAITPHDEHIWWTGCAYDALSLAKQLMRNRYAVTLVDPAGKSHDHDQIAAMRY